MRNDCTRFTPQPCTKTKKENMIRTLWKQLILMVAVVLCGWTTAAQAVDPPEHLSINDLAHRPERWPDKVTLKMDGSFNGKSHSQGESLKLIDFDGQTVVLSAGPNEQVGVSADDCDLLEAANAMWAKLTPAQRTVDVESIARDMSLWPAKVATQVRLQLGNGSVIQPGTDCEVIAITPRSIDLFTAKPVPMRAQVLPAQTDLVARARERAVVEPAERPSRIAEALKGSMVDAKGQPYVGDAFSGAKVFVLYFGASWCAPCRQFSPKLVKFIKENSAANPRMTVAMLNNDKDAAMMLGYMQSEKMPFPAVPLAVLQTKYTLLSYAGRGIPQLVVTDRDGKVLANSFENNQYVGPDRTLAELKNLLASGAAK